MTTDADLLRAYRSGDVPAFTELARRHLDWLYAVARRRTGDAHAAEDVLQSTLMALATHRPTAKETTMAPWLFGVVRNLAAKHHRAAARRNRHEAAAAAVAVQPPAGPGDADLPAVLDELLPRLPADDTTALLLRFYEKRSHAEVGRALGVGEEAARKRVDRAVDKLRTLFAERGLTPEAVSAGLAVVVVPPPQGLAERVLTQLSDRATPVPPRTWPAVVGVAAVAGIVIAGIIIGVRPAAPTPAVAATQPATLPAATAPATRPSSMTLAELAEKLQETERKLENVTVRNFRTVTSVGQSPDGPWKETPEVSMGSAWFDNRPDGRARIDYAWTARQWIDGAAPYAADSQTIAWDGQAGRLVWFVTGPSNKPFKINRYMIYDKRPPAMSYVGDTGVNLLLNFAGEEGNGKLTLGETMAEAARMMKTVDLRKIQIGLVEETVDGVETIRFRVRHALGEKGSMTNSIWFVPSRGYALLKKEELLLLDSNQSQNDPANIRQYLRLAVLKSSESDAGVWTATEAERVILAPAIGNRPAEFRRTVFTANAMIVNDPEFDPTLFSPAIPAGFTKDQ